jgi:PilZ domain
MTAASFKEVLQMDEIRRLLPRQFADWRGRFLIEDDAEEWRDCRVIDISTAGAGLTLLGTSADELVGRQLILAVQLRGELRFVKPSRDDALRVGIQFGVLSEAERAYLDSLSELQALW